MEKPLTSPLRYPGSKRRLSEFVVALLKTNKLKPELFVEPFCGGASVALNLLGSGNVAKVGLLDKDPLISSFWKTVFFDTNWLIEKIKERKVTLRAWQRIKDSKPISTREQAYKCLFLNRTSFSGILSPSAGPIGGKRQVSDYDIACRFPKQKIIDRILRIADYKDQIAFIMSGSWKEVFNRAAKLGFDKSSVFYYVDPPFYLKAERLYNFFFKESDHRELASFLSKETSPWLVSYDANVFIENLYSSNGNRQKKVETLYSLSSDNGQYPIRELIITNLARLPRRTKMWTASKAGTK